MHHCSLTQRTSYPWPPCTSGDGLGDRARPCRAKALEQDLVGFKPLHHFSLIRFPQPREDASVYSRSSNNVVSFNIILTVMRKKKNLIPNQVHGVCGVCKFSLCLQRFSLGTLISSNISKMCTLD